MRAARAHDEIKLLRCIDRAAEDPRYWRAAAWKLERINPERYARPNPKVFTMPHVNHILRELLIETVLPFLPNNETKLELIKSFDRRKHEILAEGDNVAEAALELATEKEEPLPADAA